MSHTRGSIAAVVCIGFLCATPGLRASIITTGDVTPDPATSTASTDVFIANTADGAVTVNSGSSVTSAYVALGNQSGVTGTATVTGTGSDWNSDFYIGTGGKGTLNIADGGTVNGWGYLGYNLHSSDYIPGAVGTATVSGPGSTWTGGFYVGFEGDGSLQVSNGATISGMGYIGEDTGTSGIVTLTGPNTNWIQGIGGIYVGDSGKGILNLLNGATASSDSGYIGGFPGGSGVTTIDGAGSSWTGMNGGLYVALDGSSGTLKLTHGGIASSDSGYVGDATTGTPGSVTIDGAGSAWLDNKYGIYIDVGTVNITHGGLLESIEGYVGSATQSADITVSGSGSRWNNNGLLMIDYNSTVSINNGGVVTATSLDTNQSSSLLTMTVGDGSSLDLGTGAVTNNGIIRLAAAPSATAGNTYTPITASSSSSWGIVQALGGNWNGATATFTVSASASTNAGTPVTIDLSQQQRVTITDPSTGNIITADLLAATFPSNLTFTANPLDAAETAALDSMLPQGQNLVAGWTFDVQGYTPGDPVYLSFAIGSGYPDGSFEVWHYDGSTWTPYMPGDLNYDGTDASFTVTGFSGYALTVPEPASFGLIGIAGLIMLERRRQRMRD